MVPHRGTHAGASCGLRARPRTTDSLALHAGADRGRGAGCRGEASRPARHADGKPTGSTPNRSPARSWR
jgi:hypothetical protein